MFSATCDWFCTDGSQIQEATTAKKEAFEKWQQSKDRMMKIRKCIRSQRKSARKLWLLRKKKHNAELYKKQYTAEGNKIIYKLAKTRNRRAKDS